MKVRRELLLVLRSVLPAAFLALMPAVPDHTEYGVLPELCRAVEDMDWM